MQEIYDKAKKVKLLILDVDGVLTDGRLSITEDNQEHKHFYSKDGVGIKMLLRSGVEIAIITGRESKAVNHRLEPLGVKYIYQAQQDKRKAYTELKNILSIADDEIAYVGDDLPDLPVMRQVGLPITVADGEDYVKLHSDYVTKRPGGFGAVREACELIMFAQGTFTKMQQFYL